MDNWFAYYLHWLRCSVGFFSFVDNNSYLDWNEIMIEQWDGSMTRCEYPGETDV